MEQVFIKTFGQSDEEIALALNLDEKDSGFSEVLINLGYVWIEKHSVWINKDTDFSEEEETLLNQLRK